MKFSNYMPEFICLLLFTFFSCLWVISLKEDMITNTKLSPLLLLEKLIPQHEVQLLNANFSDQEHYDQLAQLQSEVEALVFKVDVTDTSEQLFKDYKETSLSYIQLTSMLKTSQRLISENSQFENTQSENTQLINVIDNIRLKMFSFLSTPNRTDKTELVNLLNGIDIDSNQQTNWRYLQLVKLHSLFILDNYELTATYRRKLIGMPVVEAILQERELLQQRIRKTTIKKFAGIIGTIFSLVLLFVVVIKRNEHALKKISDQHKDFATSLMDMLGPHAKEVQGKRIHKSKDRQKSRRIRK